MTVVFYDELEQGSPEWLQARCGLLTASTMKSVITAKLKESNAEVTRVHAWELLSQRITGRVPDGFQSDAMARGHEDEHRARALYESRYAPVRKVGFVTNDKWGFKLGYSPDGLVDPHGLIEAKSRDPKYQVQTIAEHVLAQTIPDDFVIQVQTGLLVSERKWCDFISFSNGLPMATIRVWPDRDIQLAILEATSRFERRLAEKLTDYQAAGMGASARLIPTEYVEPTDDSEIEV